MISKLLLLINILSIISGINLSAQHPFNIINDFGHSQSNGHQIFEHDNKYYVSGQVQERRDTLFENNIFTSIINTNGTLISQAIWDNPIDEKNQTNGYNFLNDHILINNKLYLTPTSSSFVDNSKVDNCILVLNLDNVTPVLSQLDCYLDGEATEVPMSSIEFPKQNITIVNVSQERIISLSRYDLLNESYSFYDLSPDNYYAWNCIELLTNEDNDELLIIGQYNDYELTFDVNESVFGIFIMKVDEDFNVISLHKYGTHLIGSLSNMASLRDSYGNYVITTHEIDTTIITPYTPVGDTKRRPIIMKFDKDLNLLWSKPIQEEGYRYRYPHYYESMVEAHDNDDYILVGNNAEDPFIGNTKYGVIARTTSDGDLVWYYRVGSLFGDLDHQFFDVVATSDGHYVASGTRSGIFYEADSTTIESVTQTWLLKFDNDGRIVDVLSDTDDIVDIDVPVTIFPNPTQGNIFVQQNTSERLSYEMVDNNGKLINAQTHASDQQVLFYDTSVLSPGIYHIIVRDAQNKIIQREKISIVR